MRVPIIGCIVGLLMNYQVTPMSTLNGPLVTLILTGLLLNYQVTPMSTLNGPLVTLILTVAHITKNPKPQTLKP